MIAVWQAPEIVPNGRLRQSGARSRVVESVV
jgi:hypothetical protein